MDAFLAELRRRNVIRVAAAYLVVAWVVMQVVNVATPALNLPEWFDGAVFVLLAAGFVIALVLSWVFELTPVGLKATAPLGEGAAPVRLAGSDIILIGAVVALLGVSVFQVVRPRTAPVAEAPAVTTASAPAAAVEAAIETADALSIAVLPFVNMSPDPEQEYFSDGLSEELLNVLAQIDELRVAGRTSSFAFKDQNQDLRIIGEALGVANILEGSVRKSGDRLRITAQLVSAADGYHLWSQTYDRELTDVFAIQEEIAMAVAEALSITLGVATAPVPETATADVETYDLYLRGRAAFNRGDELRAVELFREALARDPDYAPAFGDLATAYAFLIGGAPDYRPDTMQALADLTAEWQARAPDSWATRYGVSLGHWYRREFSESFREMARVQELAPASAVEVAAMAAGYESYVGRATTAVELAQDLVRTDPLSTRASGQLRQALDAAGRRDEAEAETRRILDFIGRGGNVPDEALFRIWNDGDDAETAAVFDQVLVGQAQFMPLLAAVREVFDDPEAARALLRAGFDDPANQDPTRQRILAIYAGHYGDPELAVEALRRSYIEMGGTIFITLWHQDLAAARRTEGFKDLVRDLGLVDFWRETGDWGDFCRPVGADDFECE